MASSEQAEDQAGQGSAGCGLAVYTLLLATLGIAGVVGVVMSSFALLQGDGTSPGELTSGANYYRELEQGSTGLIPEADIAPLDHPDAWHDETALGNGERACALVKGAVVRVEDGVGTRLAFEDIEEVRIEDLPDRSQVVIVRGKDAGFSCAFGQGEGGLRMLRQIQTEQLRQKQGQAG